LTDFIVSEGMRDYRGYQMILHFPNNYGASLIRGPHSYGGQQGLYEIAVILFDGDDWELCYTTDITSDVLGRLDEEAVMATLREIYAL